MAYEKKNFKVDDRVTFVKIEGDLAGLTGTVLAHMPTHSITDDYIVGFDTPVSGQKAIVITEACLEVA